MLKLFAKYTSIGVLNTLIHWVVFGVCIYAAHTNQALANFAGDEWFYRNTTHLKEYYGCEFIGGKAQ